MNTNLIITKGRKTDFPIFLLFVCVIENKYGSEEHTGQCQAYKTFIEEYSQFRNYSRKIYIFLDLNVPTDEQLDKKLGL